MERGRARGGGRGGRGGSSGRGGRGSRGGRGARGGSLQPRALDLNIQPAAEAATTATNATSQPDSLVEQRRIAKRARFLDRKNLNILSPQQKATLLALREKKQVGRFLLPDAPERKQKRKASPTRSPCPLVPGTPQTPPPRVPQPWEPQPGPSGVNASGPSRCTYMPDESADSGQNAPFGHEIIPFLSPSTGVQRVERLEEIEGDLVDVEFELVGFTPESSTVPPIFGSESPADVSQQAESMPEDNPAIFEDDEGQFRVWEQSIGCNPGSDIDDDVDVESAITLRRRDASEYPASLDDVVLHEAMQQLEQLDIQDDAVLRGIANEDMLHFDWRHDPDYFTGQRETFKGPSGPTFPIDGLSPLDILERIWDDNIVALIVTETNKYARMLLQDGNLKDHSRLKKWKDVTEDEIWVFFAICMLQSIIHLSVEKDYWVPCLPYLKVGNFEKIMPHYRFTLIKKALHFVDNTTLSRSGSRKSKKIAKIEPIIEHLNNKFSSLYLPEQVISIDESLLLWKGRLSFAQLIANKSAKVGIKSYELCESRTGYLWHFFIYTGKSEKQQPDSEMAPNEPDGATSKIVFNLVRPLLHKGHTLVMDNFYNSPLLSRTLKSYGTDTIGTLRLNREFVPESLKNKTKINMRTGEVAHSQTQDLTIVVWKDSNIVSLISTYHKVEVGGKEKYGYFRYKPQVVLDYNLTMGGIDKKDQLLQAFPVERTRNAVWYKKLFRRLLNITIHNAFVIFSGKEKISQRQFRMQLADSILKKYNRVPVPVSAPAPIFSHFPVRNGTKRARCKQCAKNKVISRTVWKCAPCNANLCIEGCFHSYHNNP